MGENNSTEHSDLLSEMTVAMEKQRKLLGEQSKLIAKLLIQKKPTVTREWVEAYVDKFAPCDLPGIWMAGARRATEEEILDMLKELGVEVVEKDG